MDISVACTAIYHNNTFRKEGKGAETERNRKDYNRRYRYV
jgi:hypothetical protein